jgi:hypothetical protein
MGGNDININRNNNFNRNTNINGGNHNISAVETVLASARSRRRSMAATWPSRQSRIATEPLQAGLAHGAR